ncbi:MAG: LamB/YcsF family protein [Desulfarculaceae bacterium]|nr:LamB/YcsF family protein [Desulfarculaceae bacterium]
MNIDLNADMGESFGMYKLGDDAAFMQYITSANVACGFHAGDPSVMRQTVALAAERGVAVGAHPGLPDLQGFGRREMKLTPDEIYDNTMYQAGALKAFCEAAGTRLHHVKPHGSLYGMAHKDPEVARAICSAAKDLDPELYLYIMKVGVFAEAAQEMGLRTVYELYSDLSYDAQGNLVITRSHDAVDPEQGAARVVRMVTEGKVIATDGSEISITGSSVCVHGDTEGADVIITTLRRALEGAGCTLVAPQL